MLVLGIGILEEAKRLYPNAKSAIERWRTLTTGAAWKNREDIKQHFNGTDPVGKCVGFNVKGNDFRLIAIVDYERNTVLVRAFLKHADYDKEGWKNECGC